MIAETWESIQRAMENSALHALAILGLSVLAAVVVEVFVRRTLLVLAARTETDLDDQILHALRRPIFLSVILVGAGIAVGTSGASARAQRLSQAGLRTVAAAMWCVVLMQVGGLLLRALGRRGKEGSIFQARSVPIFDFLLKVTVAALGAYALLVIWNVDITAWLASAGIAGIAVGFAAQKTLANLFAGIFILADAPYKVGDVIVMDDGGPGVVTEIGIRSTRLLTRDGVLVIVPNSIIAESKIVNQTGGPSPKVRVRCRVSAAYGSDAERVREVMLHAAEGLAHVVSHPKPAVRFCSFGASGLDFELLCWIAQPTFREETESELHFRVYGAFSEAGIEIPYSKHDVYIKELPEKAAPALLQASKGEG